MLDTGSLTFLWPSMLWLLVAVPLAAALYWALARRRTRSSALYASLQTVGGDVGSVAGGAVRGAGKGASKIGTRMQRMLPGLLWILALTALILAVARPQAALTLPARLDAVMLALDMSNSMRATDIKPTD